MQSELVNPYVCARACVCVCEQVRLSIDDLRSEMTETTAVPPHCCVLCYH